MPKVIQCWRALQRRCSTATTALVLALALSTVFIGAPSEAATLKPVATTTQASCKPQTFSRTVMLISAGGGTVGTIRINLQRSCATYKVTGYTLYGAPGNVVTVESSNGRQFILSVTTKLKKTTMTIKLGSRQPSLPQNTTELHIYWRAGITLFEYQIWPAMPLPVVTGGAVRISV